MMMDDLTTSQHRAGAKSLNTTLKFGYGTLVGSADLDKSRERVPS